MPLTISIEPPPRVDPARYDSLVKSCLNGLPDTLKNASARAEYLSKLAGNATFVEARRDDRLLGVVAVYTNDSARMRAFISLVAVSPEARGFGLGKDLLMATINHVEGLSFKSIELEVLSNNLVARKLYDTLNFELVVCGSSMMTMRTLLPRKEVEGVLT